MTRLVREAFFCGVAIAIGLAVLFAGFANPWELLSTNFIISIVAVIAAAFANATAIGGGFLFVPLFILGFGLSPTESLKLSLATQAFGMTSGAIGWSGLVVRRALTVSLIASFLGMYIGTYWWVIPNLQIKQFFGWVSLLVGLCLLLEMRFGTHQRAETMKSETLPKGVSFAGVCFLGGIVTAWTSIGIGEVVLLFLLFVYGIRIEMAIATGVAALAADSILGLTLHSQLGGIHWEYLVFTAPAAAIGGRYGARIGEWLESSARRQDSEPATAWSPLKLLFSAVVILDGLIMLWQAG